MLNDTRGTFLSDKDDRLGIRSPKELLYELLQKVEPAELRHGMRCEMRRLVNDHERLISMLQQRSQILEDENEALRRSSMEHQRRYEKAVREMQFFRLQCEANKQQLDEPRPPPQKQQQQQYHTQGEGPSCAIESESSSLSPGRPAKQPMLTNSYLSTHSTSLIPSPDVQSPVYDLTMDHSQGQSKETAVASRSPSCSGSSMASSVSMTSQYWLVQGTTSGLPTDPIPSVTRINDDSKSITGSMRRKPAAMMMMTPASSIHSVSMTPVRSSTSANGYTGEALIQQRRVDPLIFGGSDGLWDTLAKHKGSDVTVEKTITNFLRRGGSPNTAKQAASASSNPIKYGYGMVHALVVTKASTPLDLLLQQGANPNAMTLSHTEDDKVTPCYLAASVGWLAGLQKLVQAGGDLMAARGAGIKNKTALHVAAENCHAAVVEYVVTVTQGGLNLEQDSDGHTDLVSYLARTCQIPVDQPDNRGELPLHWAARHGRLEVMTLLIERCGCNVNAYIPHKLGTPLDLAKSAGQRRLVDYLKGVGALTAKKMDKKRDEETGKARLENRLAKNGFGMFFADGNQDEGLF
ncbi:ankyrin repeat-containing domain protein [Dichotomocladium elegans]|nr:ankyrin repeat-containing domain protein [Dichotomocladium elegans]